MPRRRTVPDPAADRALDRDWSVCEADEAVAAQGADAERGLTREEADRRRAQHGPNELDAAPPEPAWRRFARQFADPLVYLLLAAVAVSLAAWAAEGAAGVPIEALVIVAIVLANALLGFFQEARAADAVAALQSMSEVTAGVVRDGRTQRIPAAQIVPGDILLLGEGDSVAADARLLRTASLQIAEASLTGESQPVVKSPAALAEPAPLGDRASMVFKGTAVTQGTGRAVVTGVGMGTEMGRIAAMLSSTEDEKTPLAQEIEGVGRVLGISVIVIALVIMATIALTSGVHSLREAIDILLVGVSLAVAAVPEGLPAILSVVLSLGVQAMSRRNAIITSLSSVETLGSASVICSDKTGTLTRNEMTMVRSSTSSGTAELEGIGYAPEGRVLVDGTPLPEHPETLPQRLEQTSLLVGGALASDAVVERREGAWEVLGDPTEAALVVAERKAGLRSQREGALRPRRRGAVHLRAQDDVGPRGGLRPGRVRGHPRRPPRNRPSTPGTLPSAPGTRPSVPGIPPCSSSPRAPPTSCSSAAPTASSARRPLRWTTRRGRASRRTSGP